MDMAAGSMHSLALTADGTPFSFGRSADCGLGTATGELALCDKHIQQQPAGLSGPLKKAPSGKGPKGPIHTPGAACVLVGRSTQGHRPLRLPHLHVRRPWLVG